MAQTFFSTFFPRYFKSGALISHRERHFRGDIFSNFSALLSTTVGPLLTIVGYFTSETMMVVSDGNITTFLIQRPETNETQHIYNYFSNTRVFPPWGL